MGTGALLGVVLQRVLIVFEGVNGVLEESEEGYLVNGEVWDLSGVGRIPHPV